MTSSHGERIGNLRSAHRRCLEAVISAATASAATLDDLRRMQNDLHRLRSAARAHLVAQVAGHPEPPVIPDTPDFSDFDRVADITVRHEMFQKAMWYWEGRWILEIRGLSEARKRPANDLPASIRAKLGAGRAGTLAMLRRWCMLTPCLDSTLHSLPKHFRHAAFMGQVGPKREFASNFLCDGIDLPIMNEAGQVAPHVGAAAFGLARRAVVVGDVHQIEPVVSCTPPFLLAPPGGDELQGSVMRLAQVASGATSVGMETEPSISLSEHHRCQSNIIRYCNELAYKARLEPRTPPPSRTPPLRPLKWAHVQGACVRRAAAT